MPELGHCTECNCPHNWHSWHDGECFGCGRTCQSQVVSFSLPFEIAQDLPQSTVEVPHGRKV